MMRKMAYVGIAYIAGLFFASFFDFNIILLFITAIVAILIAYIVCFRNKKKEIIVVVISFCVAMTMNLGYTKLVYQNVIKYDNQKVTFKGEIINFSQLNNDKAFYTVKGKINGEETATLIVYTDFQKCDYFDNIVFEGTLAKLEDSLTFPSESYYKAKNIFLETNEVVSLNIIQNNKVSIKKYIRNYRDYIFKRITTILPGDEGAFLGALLCGDKSSLDVNVKTTLYRAGIGHIIAISGAHLMIIAGLLLWFLKKLRINRWGRFFIIETVIIAFTVFSGLSISVIRAGIMFTILMLGTIAKRQIDILNSIGIAGIILTIASPFAIRDASLLLSLSGVFGIAVFAPVIVKFLDFKGKYLWLKNSLITMLCTSIATLPFVVLFFDEVSLISPITNILLAPLCAFALLCGLIVAIFGGTGMIAYPMLTIAGMCLKSVLLISKLLVKIPFSYIPLGYTFIPLALAFALIGIFVITYIFKTKKALLSSILASILVMLISTAFFTNNMHSKLRIAILSQNNSTAIVLYKSGQASIIDIEGKGKISEVVEKFINKKGINNIKILLLTENSQKLVSSYVNNISAEIENICTVEDEIVVLPEGHTNKINMGTVIKITDYEITILENKNYLIKYGDFSLLCEEKNDTILSMVKNNSVNFIVGQNDKKIEINNQIILFDKTISNRGEAFLLISDKSGNYSIRRMHHALRE